MADVYDAGKSALVLNAGVGAFDVYQVDGVVHVTNGNSGKNPSSTPERGGFSGWTMVGIDPAGGLWREADTEWLDVEINPFVDALSVTGPTELAAGEVVDLQGTIDENGRLVPAEWPVSVRWAGSEGVYVGDPASAPGSAIVALDPRTGTVTALDRVVVVPRGADGRGVDRPGADGRIVPRTKGHVLDGAAQTYPVEITLTVNDVTPHPSWPFRSRYRRRHRGGITPGGGRVWRPLLGATGGDAQTGLTAGVRRSPGGGSGRSLAGRALGG
jgi:hypothetical protein